MGCGSTPPGPERSGVKSVDIFANEEGNLAVRNEAGFDAVLFAGRPVMVLCPKIFIPILLIQALTRVYWGQPARADPVPPAAEIMVLNF